MTKKTKRTNRTVAKSRSRKSAQAKVKSEAQSVTASSPISDPSPTEQTIRPSEGTMLEAVLPESVNGIEANDQPLFDEASIAPAAPQVDVSPVTEVSQPTAATADQPMVEERVLPAPIGQTVVGKMRQLFTFGSGESAPKPEVMQTAPQAEFAPLDRTQETGLAEPDILQPGPQAEFRDMPETTPESAPQAVETIEDEAQPAEEPTSSPVEEDLEYVRVIRALAMIVIVAEHWAFPIIYRYNNLMFSEWWIGTGIYLWGKAGSPLFTMVSGLLLLNPSKNSQTLSVFFKKRFMKVLIPFLAWSAIYLAWQIYWVGTEYSVQDIIVAIVDGPVFYHLWFIQMILGLYLATPVMRIYTRHATRHNMTYFLVVWFVGTGLFPIVRRYLGFEVGIDMYVMVGFMGYFVLGYYLRPIQLNRQQMLICLGVIAVFSLLTMNLTHWMTVRAGGTFDNFFALNTGSNIMVLTTAFFLFMKSLDYKSIYERHPWFKWFIKHTASTSFGLYLIHVLILEEIRSGRLGFDYNELTWNPAISIPVLTAVVMFVSIIIVKRMQQIPYIKNIVP